MKIYQVDSFTEKVFSGNPAGVCILEGPADERWMQDVAMEMNLSETAFLYRKDKGFNLRWFTPAVEVDLCGHATLASAHILWETGILDPGTTVEFHSKSGILTAKKDGDYIMLDFPAKPESTVQITRELELALGASVKYCGCNKMDYLAEVEDEETVRQLEPDLEALKRLKMRGIMVTSRASGKAYDFVSRFFAPGAGINEDPVTGSSHCCLTPYWAKKLGKTEMLAYQASKRGGFLKVISAGDRVLLGGKAVTVFCADFRTE